MSGSEERKPVRQRILETVAEMFYREGVRAVGIDAIIARSGIAKMSLYRNFTSKDALVSAWLEERDAAFWRRWDRAEATCPGDSRVVELEAILEMVAARVVQRVARLPVSEHRHRISGVRPPGPCRDPRQQARRLRPIAGAFHRSRGS